MVIVFPIAILALAVLGIMTVIGGLFYKKKGDFSILDKIKFKGDNQKMIRIIENIKNNFKTSNKQEKLKLVKGLQIHLKKLFDVYKINAVAPAILEIYNIIYLIEQDQMDKAYLSLLLILY